MKLPNHSLSLFLLMALFAMPAPTRAGEDDFNRSTDDLGDQWTILSGSPFIRDEVVVKGDPQPVLAVWNADSTTSTGFTIAADTLLGPVTATLFSGVAFNVQDVDNYYVVRINSAGTVQFYRFDGGKLAGVKTVRDAFTIVANEWVRVEVSSTIPHLFEVRILRPDDGAELWSGTFTDTARSHQDGRGGLYSSSATLRPKWDNFKILTP
jgi:hypothetical protein